MIRVKSFLLVFPVMALASGPSVTVKTHDAGPFTFLNLELKSGNYVNCRFSGVIENGTQGGWTEAAFGVTARGPAPGEIFAFDFIVESIPFKSTTAFDRACRLNGKWLDRLPPFKPASFSIIFNGGYWEPGPEAAKREQAEWKAAATVRLEAARAKVAAEAKARRDKEAAAAKARAEYLAKFPTIQSGFTSAFVGSDKKCSAQFLEATAMEGLEKRKRLADLISFGCGFIAKNDAHVSVERKDGTFAYINLIDGDKAGKSGWVPASWVAK